jgi:hypothetical protein
MPQIIQNGNKEQVLENDFRPKMWFLFSRGLALPFEKGNIILAVLNSMK